MAEHGQTDTLKSAPNGKKDLSSSKKGGMSASSFSVSPSPTRSCEKLVKTGAGEYLAVCHSPKTGYKAPNAYGARPLLQSETTKDYYENKVHTVGSDEKRKRLTPYHPNAPRNRPRWTLSNVQGVRFGVPKDMKNHAPERYRGESHLQIKDGTLRSQDNFRTTKQVYEATASLAREPPGLHSNPGVFADVARTLHAYQSK